MISTFAFSLAIASAVLHAIWNLLARGNPKRELLIQVSLFFGAVIAIPFSIARVIYYSGGDFVSMFAGINAPLIIMSALFEVLYLIFLTRAYATGNLAETYAVARGSAPVLVAIAGFVFFRHALSPLSWVGIGMVSIGLGTLKQIRLSNLLTMNFSVLPSSPPFFYYALAAGVCIASFTLVDYRAVHEGDPLLFKSIVFLLMGIGLTITNLAHYRLQEMISFARDNLAICLITGMIMFFGYGLMLFAMRASVVSLIAPIRETSIVFAVLFGWIFLNEKPGPRQLLGVVIVALGVLMLLRSGPPF